MNETAREQAKQLLTEPIVRRKVGLAARLLSVVILVYVIGWGAEFIFISREFGFKNAIGISFLLLIPFLLIISMRRRWKLLGVGDWGLLFVVVAVAAFGTKTFQDRWYESGWHYRHGKWTFFPAPSQESLNWSEFKEEFHKDPSFKNLRVHRPKGSKDDYWLEGTLESEADLVRLIALAKKCRINRDRLDGPYYKSISILIPGTERSKPNP